MDPTQPQNQDNENNPFDQYYPEEPNNQATPTVPTEGDAPLPETLDNPTEQTTIPNTPTATSYPAGQPTPNIPPTETPPTTNTADIFEAKTPIHNNQTPSKTNPYIVNKMQMSIRKIIFGITIFILMIIVGLAGALIASGQLADITQPLSRQLHRLPFYPKNATYILEQMALASLDITSFSYDFSTSFDVQDQKFDLAADGKVKLNTQGITDEFEFNSKLKAIATPYTGEMAFNVIGIQNGLYVKLDSISGGLSSFARYLPPLNQWYFIDLQPLATQARSALQQNQTQLTVAVTPLPHQLQQSIQSLFSSEKVKDHITLNDNQTLADGTDTFHLRFDPTPEIITDYIIEIANYNQVPLTTDETLQIRQQVSNIQNFEVEVWIDTKTYYVRKVQLLFSYKIDTNDFADLIPTEMSYQETITSAMIIELSNINSYTPITIPRVVQPIDAYFQMLTDTFMPVENFEIQFSEEDIFQQFEFEPRMEDAFSF